MPRWTGAQQSAHARSFTLGCAIVMGQPPATVIESTGIARETAIRMARGTDAAGDGGRHSVTHLRRSPQAMSGGRRHGRQRSTQARAQSIIGRACLAAEDDPLRRLRK